MIGHVNSLATYISLLIEPVVDCVRTTIERVKEHTQRGGGKGLLQLAAQHTFTLGGGGDGGIRT